MLANCQALAGKAIFQNHLCAFVRECYVLASNRRVSATNIGFTDQPTLRAVVVESITVAESHRNSGLCRAFLTSVLQQAGDRGFDLVIVEGVGNPILAAALDRWGWECDSGVMDFYRKLTENTHVG